jgi:hypothetical protein
MMSTIAFDTLKFVRKLKEAVFEEKQAEAVADAFRDAQSEGQPITREYFDIRLKAEIDASKADMIKWIAGLLLAQAGLVAALVKIL